MTAHRRQLRDAAWRIGLVLVLAGCMAWPAWAQSTNLQQQARADQVRGQMQSSSLREQQRQQTSNTTSKAFQQGSSAQQGIRSADRARYDRYRARQRDRVQDYLHREQAASTAHSGTASPSSQPAHASSSR